MATRPSRYRSSTSASNPPPTSKAFEVLQNLFHKTAGVVHDGQTNGKGGYPDIQALLKYGRQLHQHITANPAPCPAQDDFRHLRGYQQLLDLLRAFSGFYDPQRRSDAEKKALFEFLHIVLAVLSATFREHSGNRQYFRYRVRGGGWDALEQIIASIGLGGSDSDPWTYAQLFGKLLSFALDDQRLDELCQSVVTKSKQTPRSTKKDGANTAEENASASKMTPETSQELDEEQDDPTFDPKDVFHNPEMARAVAGGWDSTPSLVDKALADIVGPKTVLHNPEIMRAVVGFWESMPRIPGKTADPISLLVLATLSSVTAASFFNLSALHGTGVLSRFLWLYFSPDSTLSDVEKERVLPLCRSMMYLGVNKLSDAQFLLSSRDVAASEFCLAMAAQYNGPPFVQFDLSLHGHSSIELPNLGRPFPPLSTSGYTFTCWVRIDRFDPKSHTTLFGVFDSSQTCFLLAYLERDTHNFILQTSVTSQRPSVRFKSVVFKEKQWYHIALVHRKPKPMTSSKASLYVNGEFAEQIKSSYPIQPPMSAASAESFASFSSNNNKTNPVQAFLGTPRDLSTQIGPGLVLSKWSLASAHLFEDVLSDDFLAVHFRLGPRYQGNFQDCLGGFQTYEASAALGLRNEVFHPGKEEHSDILKAIRDKASTIIPEQKVIMGITPSAMFRTGGSFVDSVLFRSLSRNAANQLLSLTTKSGTAISMNTALPCINDALVRTHGVAILTGDPVLATPSYFDDNLWRLGGFTPVALKMIERTTSSDELVRTVELMFLCISKSWRNSEAMERDNGYAILAMLLQAKLGYSAPPGMDHPEWRLTLSNEERDRLSFQLLSLVLAFIGYKHADPLESFIINPLAYRILLIDFDTWRKAAPITQELYYKQFVTFAVNSKYHQFNSRRLLRMRIIKRLLDAVKAEPMSHDILPHFLASFESLIKCNYNAEVHRSLALFITYAFHTPASSLPRTPRPFTNTSRSSTPGPRRPGSINTGSTTNLTALNATKHVTKKQLGARMLEMYTRLLSEKGNVADIKKFARTVTNKVTLSDWQHLPKQVAVLTSAQWLLYLLAEDDPTVVLCGCRILARLLVTHGSGYTGKFASKTGGFTIMAHRLKHWWDVKELWVVCWCLLFGKDVAEVDVEAVWSTADLVKMFEKSKVVYPDAMPVIVAMLQQGLRDVMQYQDDPDSPVPSDSNGGKIAVKNGQPEGRPRAKSAPVAEGLMSRKTPGTDKDRIQAHKVVLQSGIRFLAELHSRSSYFRDFALSSDYVRLLLSALYPVIVSADAVSPETELHSKNSALTFDGGDVLIRPVPGSNAPAPIVRTSHVTASEGPSVSSLRPPRGTPLRKASSFILLTSQESAGSSPVKLAHVLSPKKQVTAQQANNSVLEGILELVIGIFVDQVMTRKEFPGFGLFTKVPPGFKEHQAYFESYVLRTVLNRLTHAVQANQKLLCEPRVLTNMARFVVHMTECSSEGWFMNGAEAMLDFAGQILEYLQRSDVSSLKSVRLCSQAVSTIRISFLKLVLLRLSDMDDASSSDSQALAVLQRIFFWQTVLLACLSADDDFMKLLWYQLYAKLLDTREPIRLVAASIWRVMLVQMPDESAAVFRSCATPDQQQLVRGFSKLTEVDDGAFVEWIDQHRPSLDVLFFSSVSKSWEDFVAIENQRTLDSARSRVNKRKERLKHWLAEGKEKENVLLRHEMANNSWMKSIYVTEHFKHQRVAQDHQDDFVFLTSTFAKMERDLRRPGSVFAEPAVNKWKLDRTEGRNRMRLRILPDYSDLTKEYQSKRKVIEATAAVSKLSLDTKVEGSNAGLGTTPLSSVPPADGAAEDVPETDEPSEADRRASASDAGVAPEDDFELIDDPNDPDDEGFEDKNRKVMRRLEHGDSVQSVYNICRIIGLETCEGILIIGKDALYLMDNVFQCQDGEIVNVWQAPIEERDPFSQIVAFNKPGEKDKRTAAKGGEQESRSWRWHDVISVSKRRFLFRDVAIEVFFRDGRSYLLTALDPQKRDEVYGKLMTKTPHTAGPNSLPNPEDIWRLEALKVFEETPQTFGSKFGSIFNSSPWNPLMRRWQKGEISNFHYLMLVNTMAGRTFNDLTQYPVFPWVLADYTSDELDLNDPATFRDLSKPMGAQTIQRQSDFIMRYNSLAEIGQPPFHYGTHYSSAMVVSSYLIRLPPFVDSYLLLQGGSFDHPDRLFYSIEGAWKSASRDNGTDVRELTPEFFCLPEFLTNINGYDFGKRQDGSKVDSVKLPPWAKGDPHIFIAKHREALESPYVSQNLHYWLDLVFGHKQRGDAAVENLNVFHHLSYHGAIDLDNIQDKQERAIVTGIIHNFGQTPHQVFSKPHPHRENITCGTLRLDTSVHALTRLPYTLLESHERVASLIYAPKLDRLLCASPFRVNYPPFYDKFLEWGFADNSVRFFFTDNRKPAGLFENLHIGQISCLKFADSKTLITAGEDCVVSVYSVASSATTTSHSSEKNSHRAIELLPRDSLFGHKTPVVAMAVSKALSTLLTVGRDGVALLWDLNRLEFIRRLPVARAGVECARIHDVSGEIMLCAGQSILLFSANGELLLDQNVCALNASPEDDAVLSCAFYEGAGNEWLENYLVFTGHRRGRVNVWRRVVSPTAGVPGRQRWCLEWLRGLDHVDGKSERGENVEAGITCVCPMPTLVYVGDEEGRVYEWNMVRRER